MPALTPAQSIHVILKSKTGQEWVGHLYGQGRVEDFERAKKMFKDAYGYESCAEVTFEDLHVIVWQMNQYLRCRTLPRHRPPVNSPFYPEELDMPYKDPQEDMVDGDGVIWPAEMEPAPEGEAGY